MTDEAVVLHSSNLRPVKRVDLLLEAAARVRPRESFRLVILAGEGFRAVRRRLVRRLGLEGQVMVLERVPDIEEYLQAADLGLFASDSESFCLSILEAMCFGCPSVATRVGGIPEVVEDGVSGLLVPPGDAAGLARAVEALIADPTRRAAMGAAARRRAMERFSADVIVPCYEAIYRRACQHLTWVETLGPRWSPRGDRLDSDVGRNYYGCESEWRCSVPSSLSASTS